MKRKSPYFVFFIFLLLLNIISYTIILPDNDSEEPVPISRLLGNPWNLSNRVERNKIELPLTNSEKIYPNSVGQIQFSTQEHIPGGEEDAVDNNLSNVDGSDDIGTEIDFTNAQGSSVDSQFMKIDEQPRESPEVSIDSISNYNGTTNRIDFSHTVLGGSNRLLLIYIQTDSGIDVTNVTYDGVLLDLFHRIESFETPPPGPSIEIWQQLNPNVGTSNGSVVMAAVDDIAVTIISYTGVDQDDPISGLTNKTSQTRNSSITIPSSTGDLAQDVFSSSWDGIAQHGPNQTRRWLEKLGIQPRWAVGSTIRGVDFVTFFWETVNLKDSAHVAFNIRRASAPYELDLEYQWTSAEYRRQREEVAIYAGDLGTEKLRVDIWDGGGSWISIIDELQANQWNNISIESYLTSPTFTIRFKGTEEQDDAIPDTWYIDLILIVISAENVAPSAENLTLSPDPLMSNETLVLDYIFSDANNDNESGTEIHWYVYNVTGDSWNLQDTYNDDKSVPESALVKGDIWRATVRPNDGIEFGNISTSGNITIQNTPPNAQAPQILPGNPKTGNELTASYSWSDPDIGDIDSNSKILWYKDNGSGYILQPFFTNKSIIPSNATKKDDLWRYDITPSDGEDYGNTKGSSPILIENTLPFLSVNINNHTTPQTVADDQDLIGNYTYFDADNQDDPTVDIRNDSLLNIRWYKYNSVSGDFELEASDVFTIDNSLTSTGDLWRCEMNISDDTGYSIYYSSPTISIDQAPNDPPSAIYINLTSSIPIANGSLTVNFTFSDTDGGNLTIVSIRWYRNSVHQPQFDDLQDLLSAQLIKDDEWFAEVRVRDEYDWGNWSSSETITIQNSAPIVTSIGIFPNVATTTNSLTADYIPYDIDGDSIILSESKIVWLNDSVSVPGLENSSTVPSILTRKGQEWQYQLWLFDGYDWSTPFLSPGIIIQNTKPTIHNVTLLGGESTNIDIELSYDFVDIDGDIDNGTQILWFLDSIPLGTYTENKNL
ncbi:MAG: hypothetical protein ACW99A_21395, partial [Candidatus Kariarchaeaceae archaeon]